MRPCPHGDCDNRDQCWEPCGELGTDEATVRVASKEKTDAINRSLEWCGFCGEGVVTFCRGKSGECAKGLPPYPQKVYFKSE